MSDLKKVGSADELIALCVRNGVKLNWVEAGLLLRYADENGCDILAGKEYSIWLRDRESDDNECPYSVRDLAELAVEQNKEDIADEGHDDIRALELYKDEYILELMLKKVDEVIPPTEREYKVVIVEHLKRVVSVTAASREEAKCIVETGYNGQEYVLDADDFAGVSFTVCG